MHKTRPWDEFHAVKIDLHEVIMGSWVVNVADIDEDYVFLTEIYGEFPKMGISPYQQFKLFRYVFP